MAKSINVGDQTMANAIFMQCQRLMAGQLKAKRISNESYLASMSMKTANGAYGGFWRESRLCIGCWNTLAEEDFSERVERRM